MSMDNPSDTHRTVSGRFDSYPVRSAGSPEPARDRRERNMRVACGSYQHEGSPREDDQPCTECNGTGWLPGRMAERQDFCGGRDGDIGRCKRYPFCPAHAGTLTDARLAALDAEGVALGVLPAYSPGLVG